jgi:hypothetical protein
MINKFKKKKILIKKNKINKTYLQLRLKIKKIKIMKFSLIKYKLKLLIKKMDYNYKINYK